MFQRPPRLLFDLDGTLIDSAPDLAATTDWVLNQFGRAPVGLAAVRDMVGDGALALIRRGFEATGGIRDEAEIAAAHQAFLSYYADHLTDHSVPFPGIVAALTRLEAAGAALAVCTNKMESFSRTILDRLDLSRFFRAVVGGDSLGVRKPDPGHITGTLDRLGGEGWAVMIGDSKNDINAARAAGVPSIVVSFGYTQIPPADLGADRLIDHFDALIPTLQTLEPKAV